MSNFGTAPSGRSGRSIWCSSWAVPYCSSEVSAGTNSVSRKHRNFFGKWGEMSNVKALKAQLGLQSTRTLRAYFDLRPRPENLGAPEREGVAGPRTMNRIYYQEDFDRLADGVRRGITAGESFLSDFG